MCPRLTHPLSGRCPSFFATILMSEYQFKDKSVSVKYPSLAMASICLLERPHWSRLATSMNSILFGLVMGRSMIDRSASSDCRPRYCIIGHRVYVGACIDRVINHRPLGSMESTNFFQPSKNLYFLWDSSDRRSLDLLQGLFLTQ